MLFLFVVGLLYAFMCITKICFKNCSFFLLGLLYAFIFGQVTSIIQQLQKPSSDYHQKLDSIRRFTKLYTVPQEIAGRLVDYYMTTWATNKGLDIDEVCLASCRVEPGEG